MENNDNSIRLTVQGMTCGSCELMVERKLKKIPGVLKVHSNHRTGFTVLKVDAENPPAPEVIEAAIQEAGYSLTKESVKKLETNDQKWVEIGASLLLIFALYQVLKGFDIFSLAPSVEGATTLAGVFVIGLVAGTSSCLAVTGGLLLSMAAKHNQVHQAESRWQKFKPLLSFNLGRLISYFFLGGVVGILGQSIALSTRMTGFMNIVIALVMFYLALSILKIIPKGSFLIKPPKAVSHWIANLSEHEHPFAPFALGALTFFLPCGFTQSLQLAALASGGFMEGALMMFVFALGTLPALLGISIISATAEGRLARLFLRFSGSLVLLLALLNFKSGLILTGVDVDGFFSGPAVEGSDTSGSLSVTEEDGMQVINLEVTNYGYSPSSFTIEAGKPTLIKATMNETVGGCISALTVPEFNLSTTLSPGENELGPIENPQSDFLITCSMGMFTATVNVVPSTPL
ncbi:sulfite exporter TauE/SafE family protein [Candidatus Peregrinibacteria bacterium]|nr:MAG: sulfite exporter TauE/SafE family protein [Candidatus Peregrinibacteria bacterium]